MQPLELLPAGCLLQRNFPALSRGWLQLQRILLVAWGGKYLLGQITEHKQCEHHQDEMGLSPLVLAVLSHAWVCFLVAVLMTNLP